MTSPYDVMNLKNVTNASDLTLLIRRSMIVHIQGVPKKMHQWFFQSLLAQYFTHMENKDRYGILTISAFHAIFCFYPTPFQSLAIVRQSTSPPKSNTLFWSTAEVHNACVMCWIQLSWKLRCWFIDKWGPLKHINKGVGSWYGSFWYWRYVMGHDTRLDIHTVQLRHDYSNTVQYCRGGVRCHTNANDWKVIG